MSQAHAPLVVKLLWLVVTGGALFLVVAGTLKPWPVAAKALASVGPGPYVPLSYSYRSSTSEKGTKEYRSQTYLVVSQAGKTWSSYRVIEEDNVTTVEEVSYGIAYGIAFIAVFIAGAVWQLQRFRQPR